MSELKHVYPLPDIMAKAWRIARRGARMFGGRATQYLREALRAAWDAVRPLARRLVAQTARVLRSIATLDADIAAAHAGLARAQAAIGETAEERFERRRAERGAAVVVPFPIRPMAPAPAAVPSLPRAA